MLHPPTLPMESPPNAETRYIDAPASGPGSWDHAQATDQMKAIDMAMRWYFESENWLDERRHGSH